jgi:hypothetical protein
MEQPEPAAEITLRAIGRVSCPRVELVDDHWGNVPSVIHSDAERFAPDALTGLADFSHLEVVYHFHRVPNEAIETGARRPRGNPNRPEVGIFAQRARNRSGERRPRHAGGSAVARSRRSRGLGSEPRAQRASAGSTSLPNRFTFSNVIDATPAPSANRRKRVMPVRSVVRERRRMQSVGEPTG